MNKIYKISAFMLMLFAFNSAYLHAQCDIEVTVSSDGYGDVTTWELQDGSGTPVLTGGTYPLGYSDTQNTPAANPPYTLVFTINNFNWCDNEPDYIVTVGGVEVLNGTVLVGCVNDVVSFPVSECPPDAPPAPTQDPSAPICATGTVLDLAGPPPADVEWYWATSDLSTSTSDPYTGPYTVFANGTYYVRAFNTVTGLWSTTSSSITVSNMPLALDPPAPVAAQSPVCLPGTTISVDPAIPGYEYYWQGTNMGGTSMADDASIPYDVTSTGTYYVAAYETATQCWSNTVGVAVTVQTEIPDAPVAATSVYDICSGLSDFDIEAIAGNSSTVLIESVSSGSINLAIPDSDPTGITSDLIIAAIPAGAMVTDLSVTININHTWNSDLDISLTGPNSTTIELSTDNGGSGDNYVNTVFSSNGVNPITGATAPMTGTFAAEGDMSTLFSVLNGTWTLLAVDDTGGDTGTIVDWSIDVSYTLPGDLNWYDAATAGTQVGTGTPFDCIGNSVLADPSTLGTYEFYAATVDGVCESATRALVTVNVIDVNADLVPIDETCTGNADGSFALGTVECGTAPFEYSIDGGVFGPIPTNLTPGTYSVVIQDAAMLESNPIMVTIGTTDTYIPDAPTANPDFYNICSGDLTQPIEAEADGSATVNYSFGTNIESFGPVFSIPLTVPALPAGATVTSAELLLTNVNSINGSWRSEIRVGLSGIYTLGDTQISLLTSGGLITPDPTIALAGFPITGGTLNLLLSETIDDGGAGTLDATFGEVVLSISYTLPATTINWYDASTAGTNLGSGSPFESVGTSVLASPATVGVYEFYAESVSGNCVSASRTLVTVNVNNVNVDLDVEDATCNNGNDGLFTIANVYCGLPPFQYSIDGGAFSPNASGLTAGTHTVIVRDFNMDESAEYTITVGSAPEPSNVVVVSYNNEEATIEWIANGSETEWNIEWGTPGFTPGTGTEVGSGTANSIPFIITGLDGDTEYEIYVSANCGVGTTTGDWSGTNVLTDCNPIPALAWCESFEDDSETIHCWTRIDNNGDANIANGWEYSQWTYWSNADAGQTIANMGEYAATNFNQFTTTADDWLITPRLTLTNNEVMTFHYLTLQGATNFTVLLSTTGKNPTDFTEELMADATYSNTTYQDTSIDLSAYGGDVYIAFVRTGATTTFSGLFIDDVCVDICTPNPGTDGSIDICRLDGTTDLNSVITSDYTHGTWSFPANPSVVNGSTFNISTLASGSYDVEYIVTTACTADTTIATINVFGPSQAGNDGNITACLNEPINLLSGLSGTVDLGGQWYDEMNNPTGVDITASNIAGNFNFDYITSNGVCPNDTANILLTVTGTCDYLDIQELVFGDMNVYPNPTDGLVFVSSTGNAEVFNYELTDVNGRVISVKEAAINGTETAEISLEKLEPGIYMIRVYNASAEKTFRVVKQ